MPRLQWRFDGDAFADGAGGDKFLIDISERLSAFYGRLIRQGNVFRVRAIETRIYNPNTLVQDEAMAVSGKFIYYHPTSNRKKAWKKALDAWNTNRKQLGSTKRGADFRVGLANGYQSAGTPLSDGVIYNAWINSASEPLMLTASSDDQDIFGNYTDNVGVPMPQSGDPKHFGHWADKDLDSTLDHLDFQVNDNGTYYVQGAASNEGSTIPFMVGFGAWADASMLSTMPSDVANVSSPSRSDGPFDVMCGLIGVYVDTTTVDDSETQTQDWGIEISVDIESWTPIVKKPKRKLKGGKK